MKAFILVYLAILGLLTGCAGVHPPAPRLLCMPTPHGGPVVCLPEGDHWESKDVGIPPRDAAPVAPVPKDDRDEIKTR